jgi:hypothetical protein
VGRDGHKKRRNEGEHGGCILYSYVKTEKLNLRKLFQKGWRRDEGE